MPVFAVDLHKMSLPELAERLRSTELLPGRRLLLEPLDRVIAALQAAGLQSAGDVLQCVQQRRSLEDLAQRIGVDINYMRVLARQISSYLPVPVPLARLEFFNDDELQRLLQHGYATTRDLYERLTEPAHRAAEAERLQLDPQRLETGLQLADLLRINGVGPLYARLLLHMGVRSVSDYRQREPERLLTDYRQLVSQHAGPVARLGRRDVAYCQYFSQLLDDDIQW